jgi:hypothetical protein
MPVIGYDVLHHMNIVRKVMRSSTMEINSAVQLLESCKKYLTEYRSTKGFERAVVDARELAKAFDEPIFVEKRFRRKKAYVRLRRQRQCYRSRTKF